MVQACCLTGTLHQGEPQGRVEKLHGLDTYISEPANSAAPTAIIVYIPDIFGWDLPNNRLLADIYARRTGARVYLPEFMNGNAFPAECLSLLHTLMTPSPSWFAAIRDKTFSWLYAIRIAVPRLRGVGDGPCRPRIISFLTALRANEAKDLKVGVAGFCWGGHHVFDLCSGIAGPDGQPLVDAGFTAHPSNVKVPADAEAVKLPLSVSVGDIDATMDIKQCKEAQRVLEAKQDASKYEFKILPGAVHGFSTRHDPKDEKQMALAQDAEDQAVAFWARWIGTNK